MIIPQVEIIILASIVSIACAIPGVFLVLRKVSLMSDAISHAILLGIVLGFFIAKDLSSPILIIGATLVGILTVSLTELLIKTRKLKEDASIGLVFPLLFSIGVILISRYASRVHIDTDAVLLGEIAFAPYKRSIVFGVDLPTMVWVMGAILLLNIMFVALFYKELKLSTFDAGLAASLGFIPGLIHYLLMGIVSITAVTAFNAVGSILVVALMIAPPSAAYLLSKRLNVILIISTLIGIVSAGGGYYLAKLFDASIAGSMAMMAGALFVLSLLFAPKTGLVAQALAHDRRTILFSAYMLLVHLSGHEGTGKEETENTVKNSSTHMTWKESFTWRVISKCVKERWVKQEDGRLYLTDAGRGTANKVFLEI